MGKGDRKTAKGKRNISSYGTSRSSVSAQVATKAATPAKAPAVKKAWRVLHHRPVVRIIMRDGRRQVDREEPTGKAGRLHPGQVEMALPLARQKDLLAPLRIKEQTQQ